MAGKQFLIEVVVPPGICARAARCVPGGSFLSYEALGLNSSDNVHRVSDDCDGNLAMLTGAVRRVEVARSGISRLERDLGPQPLM